jgi:hypothetical protein
MDPGDYLDIHRDIVTCDVAVTTCLHDRAKDDGDSRSRITDASRHSLIGSRRSIVMTN